MTYVEIEDWMTAYTIKFTDEFYNVFQPHLFDGQSKAPSFFNVLYRLYGMLPGDFYRWMSQEYGMKFKRNEIGFFHSWFTDKTKAQAFAADANSRLNFLLEPCST